MRDCSAKGRESKHFARIHGTKERCDNGHEFTPENTGWAKKGHRMVRYCRECRRVLARRHYAKNRDRYIALAPKKAELQRARDPEGFRERARLRQRAYRERQKAKEAE